MQAEKLNLGDTEFELFPFKGEKLKQWIEVQVKCATWQALWAAGRIERDFTDDDFYQLTAAACWLVVQAVGCTIDEAILMPSEDRVKIIEVQDRLNSIHKALSR